MENRARLEAPPADEHDQVLAWRTRRLLELGYPVDQAIRHATEPLDLHDVENLIRRGCAPELAVRILA